MENPFDSSYGIEQQATADLFPEQYLNCGEMKHANYLRVLGVMVLFAVAQYPSMLRGGNLSPNGEIEIELLSLEGRFPDGRFHVRLGADGSLQELLLEWKGKIGSVDLSEMKDITRVDLQSLQLTTPISSPPGKEASGLSEADNCFVTMAYGDPIVTESMRRVKRHVRFRFSKGVYSGRFTAIPEKAGKRWKIFSKKKDKVEEKFDEHDGVLQPWSLIRDRERDSEYMNLNRNNGVDSD